MACVFAGLVYGLEVRPVSGVLCLSGVWLQKGVDGFDGDVWHIGGNLSRGSVDCL